MKLPFQEEEVWLYQDSYQIHGHIAWNPVSGNGTAVLFVPPYTMEEENVYHWITRMARTLATESYVTLRYHPAGFGDSSELHIDDNPNIVLIESLKCACTYLLKLPEIKDVVLIGVRSGAWVAERLIDSGISRRIYIEPLLTANDVLREEKRRAAMGGYGENKLPSITDPSDDPKTTQAIELISCGLTEQLSFNARRAAKVLGERLDSSQGVICPPFWENMNPPACENLSQLVLSKLGNDGNSSECDKAFLIPMVERKDRLQSVTIPHGNQNLMGTLYSASVDVRGGIVLCSGYRTSRNGPSGLLRFLAKKLSSIGFTCILFDYSGRGDSEGTPELRMNEMAVATASVVDWMQSQTDIPFLSVLGICAGAEAALRASILNTAIKGLILLSASYPGGITPPKSRNKGIFSRVVKQLRRFDPYTTFSRLLRGQINLTAIIRILSGKSPAICSTSATEESIPDFKAVHADRVLFVAAKENAEDIAARRFYCDQLSETTICTSCDIEGGDHNFSDIPQRDALVMEIQEFLIRFEKQILSQV